MSHTTSALAILAGNGDAGAEHHALLPVQPEAGAGTPERRDLEEGEQIRRGDLHACGCARARVWAVTRAHPAEYTAAP